MRNPGLWNVILAVVLVAGFACGGAPEESEPPPVPACQADTDCDVGSICEDGTCQVAVCTKEYAPVCGVDGTTYGNACMARAAHVEVASEGECPQVCGGIQGILCPDGAICDLPAGLCQGADLQGICVPKPEVCPEIFEPVCGCDGKTYGNDCERLVAGAQMDHDGECTEAVEESP